MTYPGTDLHSVLTWNNAPDASTPLNKAHLEAAFQDIADYTKEVGDAVGGYVDTQDAVTLAAANAYTDRNRGGVLSAVLGMESWNRDPVLNAGASAPTAGTIYAMAMPLNVGQVVANMLFDVWAAGAGTAPTGIYVGIADSTTMLASSGNLKDSTIWTTQANTLVAAPLSSPYTVSATGLYYAVFLQVGTWGSTQMTLGGTGTGHTTYTGPLLQATLGTGQTALPVGAITPSSSGTPLQYWVGCNSGAPEPIVPPVIG